MSNTLKRVCFLFVIFLALPALSLREFKSEVRECNFWDSVKYFFHCGSFHFPGKKESFDHQDAVELCNKAHDCHSAFDCRKINEKKTELVEMCAMINYAYPENEFCLRGFFRRAYMAQFSNEESCFKKFSFLDSNLKGQSSAFMNGKSCFMEYAREYCTPETINYFNPENYQRMAETFSSKYDNSECKSAHSQLQLSICRALNHEYTSRAIYLEILKFRSSQTFVEQSIKICRDTQTCVLESCVLHKSKWLLMELDENCEAWEKLLRVKKNKIGKNGAEENSKQETKNF